MTRIDFYQIETDEPALNFACRLVDKAWRQDMRIYVHVENQGQARAMDELLWTFRAESLIPHALIEDEEAPVQIGCAEHPGDHHQLMINLSGVVPDFFSRFERVAEIVPFEDTRRASARDNYKFYKDRGYPLNYHRMQR